MKVVAHRGYSHRWGDNNLTSFQKAIECGTFDGLEIDIQLDDYNEIIIKHNLLVDFTEEKLYLKNFFEHVNVPVGMKIFFDIKGSSDIVPILENFFLDRPHDNCIFCSFNIKTLKRFTLPVTQGLITGNVLRDCDLKNILDVRIQYVFIDWNFLDREMIECCRSNNVLVYTYTPETKTEILHILKYNVDGIIINDEIHNI